MMEVDNLVLMGKVILVSYIVSAAHLKLLFHFYFPEYEMDWRSLLMIPLKTFVPFSMIAMSGVLWWNIGYSIWPGLILASGVSVYIAQRLLVKAGMDRAEAFRLIFPWFTAMLLLWLAYMVIGGFAAGGIDA